MKKRVFTEKKAEDFLKQYLPIAKSQLTKNIAQVQVKKYPVVLKIISPQALHKTEIKGVRIVNNKQELEKEYKALKTTAKKRRLRLSGILVQEFIKGQEIILGIKKDPTFNHVIMFGIGGTLVEMIKDIQFRACPITEKDADDMIDQLKFKQLLTGFRKTKSINLKLLKQLLIKTSRIPKRNKNIQELDINPLIINSKEAKVADARIVFS